MEMFIDAVRRRDLRTIDILLNENFDNNYYNDIIDICIYEDNYEVFRFLFEHYKLKNFCLGDIYNILYKISNHISKTPYIIKYILSLDYLNINFNPYLIQAISQSNYLVIEELLKDSRIDTSYNNDEALQIAYHKRDYYTIKNLLKDNRTGTKNNAIIGRIINSLIGDKNRLTKLFLSNDIYLSKIDNTLRNYLTDKKLIPNYKPKNKQLCY